MEKKFTPGVWEVEKIKELNGTEYLKIFGELKPCHQLGKICTPIVRTYFSGDRDLANAHLIASAPELYEALEMVLKFHNDNEAHGDGFLHDHEVQKVESALAKARGENMKEFTEVKQDETV